MQMLKLWKFKEKLPEFLLTQSLNLIRNINRKIGDLNPRLGRKLVYICTITSSQDLISTLFNKTFKTLKLNLNKRKHLVYQLKGLYYGCFVAVRNSVNFSAYRVLDIMFRQTSFTRNVNRLSYTRICSA